MTVAGTLTAIVLGGVLTAWADPVSGHCVSAVVLALLGVWLMRNGFGSGSHWLLFPLLFMSLWGAIQLVTQWTVYRYETWYGITSWMGRAAVFYLSWTTFKQKSARESMLTALLVCGTALSIAGTIQLFTANGRVFWLIQTPYDGEVIGTFLNRDHYAAFVELILPIALTRAMFGRSQQFVYALASAFLYASVVASGSRAGVVFVTIEGLAILLIAFAQGCRTWRRALVLTAAMLVISVAGGWQYVWFRFHAADLLAFRREMTIATLQMIHTHPLTGFGLGTWPFVYPAFAVFDPAGFFMNHAHNDWLEWTAEGGMPVALALLSLVYGAFSLAWRNWWSFGVPIALMHAAVDFPMQKQSIAALVFLLLGASAAASTADKES